MAEHLHLDFETKSACDLRQAGADVYAEHPTTDVICIGYAFDEGPVQIWWPAQPVSALMPVIRHILDGKAVIAHNAPFELAIWNAVMTKRYGMPELKPEQTFCTMAMAYALALPGSLEGAAAATGIAQQKDLAGSRVMLQLSQPRSGPEESCRGCSGTGVDFMGETCACIVWWEDEEKHARVRAYCQQDVEVERLLHKRLLGLSPSEREVWLIDYRINRRGVRIDVDAVEAALKIVELEKEKLDDEMRKITDNFVGVCTEVKRLTDWIKLQGIQTPGLTKSDVVNLLARTDLPPAVRRALILRQEAGKTSTSKLKKMLAGIGPDFRLRGLYQYHGAGTGRWAGRRVQAHNFPRPKMKQKAIEEVFVVLESVYDGLRRGGRIA